MLSDGVTPVEKNRCLNCNESLAGRYCTACGQEHIEGPLTLRYFATGLMDAFTNTDSRILHTFKNLILEPGNVAKHYVMGQRQQYVNPVRICLAMIGVYLALLALNGWISPNVDFTVVEKNLANSNTAFFSLEFHKAWYLLYTKHRLFVYLGAMPVAAIAIRYMFHQSNYNYVATLIMLLYVGALFSFYGILIVVLYSLFGFDFFSTNRKVVEGAVGLVIYFQTLKSFYNLGWFKGIMATTLVFMVLMAAAYLVTFAASWLMTVLP